jgi:NhaP-type Na+/H+ or K+/H+ antiporter
VDLGFGEALLIFGLLLAVAALLSGVMRGTVLSVSVLSVTLGVVFALTDVVSVDVGDPNVVHLIELALIMTLFADGLIVERELLTMHWGPAARSIVFAMPLTLGILALFGIVLFDQLTVAEAFLLAAVLTPTDPVVTSAVVTSQRVPERVRHTLNLESGLNDGLALPFVLFFLVLATPGGDAGSEAAKLLGEAAVGGVIGAFMGIAGGRIHRGAPAGGITARYEGIFAVGLGLAAYGLADATFGNGLIAAFVAGIALGATEHEIPDRFIDFAENVSSIFQVLTFFVFGALIVAIGYEGSIPALIAFIALALFVARPIALSASLIGTDFKRPERAFMAWFGPKGVASMLFAVIVLESAAEHAEVMFKIAAFTILCSIIAHGLTDTIGAGWVERRIPRDEAGLDDEVPGRL